MPRNAAARAEMEPAKLPPVRPGGNRNSLMSRCERTDSVRVADRRRKVTGDRLQVTACTTAKCRAPTLGTGHRAPGTGHWHWALGTGHWALGTGHWALGTGH